MLRLFPTLFLLIGIASLSAQPMHVYYDAFHDSIAYQIDGRTLEEPLMRKGQPIILHVTNFNDFVYRLEVSTKEESYTVPAAGIASLFAGGEDGEGFNAIQQLLGGGGGGLIGALGGGNGGGPALGAGGEDASEELSREATNQLKAFDKSLAEAVKLEKDIAKSNQGLEDLLLRQEQSAFMREQVNRLRYDASLAPNTSRKLMLEYLEKLLDLESGREYTLKKMLEQSDVKKDFMTRLGGLEFYVNQLAAQSLNARSVAQSLDEFELSKATMSRVATALTLLEGRTEELRGKTLELREKAPDLLDESLTDIATARYHYEELRDHRFEKQMTIYPEGDVTTLTVSLVPVNTATETPPPTRTSSPIRVKSYGGLQLNASVGISFASFFDRPLNYVNPNGVILGDELDAFTPIVTSYLHFYGQSRRNVSLAGTLGLGLGIGNQGSGGAGLSNYFLGPSLIVGKGQRIVLTAGLMGGKVDRLANGLEVGNDFLETTIPLKSVNELGFFFGVSFNVLGN